ncbi:MAG TPA: MFS transporter [Steroidobacteraceae bacterium]|jgi:predicted MFS family arabinose efflux permease|nr:MFS transporter [Steroidobacteraceae bacterium]
MQLVGAVEQEARPGWVSCYVATVIAMMAIQASSLGFSPLIPFMKESWGMSYTQMGTFTGLYGLVALMMSLPAGVLAKRYGEKPVLSVGLLLATLGLLLVALAESYGQGLVARTLWLIGYRLAFICVVTAVAITVPTHWRGNAMGLVGALTALATIIGSGFSSRMQVSVGWRLSMVGFAALTLIAAAWFMYFYRQSPPVAARVRVAQPGSPSLFSAFRIPIVWTIPLLGLANAGGFAATFFVPSVVRSEFHGGPAMASTIIAAAYGVAIVVNPLCGWLADRLDRWLVMAGMSAVMIPACLLMSSRNLYVFGLATALLVALGHAAANQVYPTAAGLLRGRDTGPIMGIVGLGSGIFGYLGPQALGWMRDYSGGFDLGWKVVMCTTVGIVLLLLQLKRYADSQSAARVAAAQ